MLRDDGSHPITSRKQDAAQRGDDPPGAFGKDEPANSDLDPNWRPNDDTKNAAEGFICITSRAASTWPCSANCWKAWKACGQWLRS